MNLKKGDENESNKQTSRPVSHGGSRTLMARIEAVNPLCHIFGHFHEGYGVTEREDLRTLFVNAAICDEDYHPDHLPITIEFI